MPLTLFLLPFPLSRPSILLSSFIKFYLNYLSSPEPRFLASVLGPSESRNENSHTQSLPTRYYSVHKSCTLDFRGTRVSYQFNIRHYVCRNVPLVHFCTRMLLIPGYHEYFDRHVTPISRNRIVLTHQPEAQTFRTIIIS
jgi:hypothetical protein